jgi:serine/threonine-protein kinase
MRKTLIFAVAFLVLAPLPAVAQSLVGAWTISPDGRDLVYVGQEDGTTRLYHRPLNQVDATPMVDTEGAENPFFSPDGSWVAFLVADRIRKVPLAGGSALSVCELPDSLEPDKFALGVTWTQDDMIWFAHRNTGLYRVPATGGVPQLMTSRSDSAL